MSSINSISSLGTSYQASYSNSNSQVKQDFKSLFSALKSGDLKAAQSALATLKQDAPDLFTADGAQTSSSSSSSNPLSDLASALGNNDLTGAQTAAASLQKGHHGHHHHRTSAATDQNSTTNTPADLPSAKSTDGATGTLLNEKS